MLVAAACQYISVLLCTLSVSADEQNRVAQSPWEQFLRRCRALRIEAIDRGSDGDCFFKSLQHQLMLVNKGSYSVRELRAILAEWLRRNENFDLCVEDPAGGYTAPLSTFIVRNEYLDYGGVDGNGRQHRNPNFDGETWNHFCDRVQNPDSRIWASHLVIIAASRHFQVQIEITGIDAARDKFFYYRDAPTVHLGHLPEFHYVSCVRDSPMMDPGAVITIDDSDGRVGDC